MLWRVKNNIKVRKRILEAMRRLRTAVTSLKQTIFSLLLLFVMPPISNAEVLTADIAQSLIDENSQAEILNTFTTIGLSAFSAVISLIVIFLNIH